MASRRSLLRHSADCVADFHVDRVDSDTESIHLAAFPPEPLAPVDALVQNPRVTDCLA
jgi:hypothetical protein